KLKGHPTLNRKKILVAKDTIIDDYCLEFLFHNNIESVFVHSEKSTQTVETYVIANSVNIDTTQDEAEALKVIYFLFNESEPKNEQVAKDFIKNLLFNRKHSLGKIGRWKLNIIANEDREDDFFTVGDLVHVIEYLLKIIAKKIPYDDVDHLGNKCLDQVGEQIYYQFYLSLSKIARIVKDKLNTSDFEMNKMRELFNTNILFNTINSFFAINQLSQYMDEINPLSTIIHKRKIAAIGGGGISKDSLVSEIRDIHYSQYGRICPIETPEGTSIGLITSLSLFAQINNYKLLITPYRIVKDGVVNLNNDNVVFLTAFEEGNKNFAQSSVNCDAKGNILDEYVMVRCANTFMFVFKDKVDYCDVASNQAFSLSTSLIPFVEHNEATRALTGANMQKQAVPLLKDSAPIVGTGMEKMVIDNLDEILKAKYDGVVDYVDAEKIIVRYNLTEEEKLISYSDEIKEYSILRMQGSNDSTCMTYHPIVKKGQQLKKGEALVSGFASEKGELAIGNNMTVAFVMMNGYNYEDAIVVSERVIRDDLLTSIHIDTYTENIRSTKLGDEEFTKDIQSVNQKDLESLDNDGLILVGTKVKEGDIIIGKVIPRGVSDSSPEEKLLRSIFGNKTCETKDASLRLPSFSKGSVVGANILQRPEKSKGLLEKIKTEIENLKAESNLKLRKLYNAAIEKFCTLLEGKKTNGIFTKTGLVLVEANTIISKNLLVRNVLCRDKKTRLTDDLDCFVHLGVVVRDNWTEDQKINSLIEKLIQSTISEENNITDNYKKKHLALMNGDMLPDGVLKLASVNIASKCKIKVGDKLSGRHGNKGVVSKILKQEDMPFLEDGTPVDIVLTPLGVPSRMNLGQLYETLLGWAGKVLGETYATPIFAGYKLEEINKKLESAGLPQCGVTQLYDGFTGEKFDTKSTVGVMYILKLNHLVDDKYHARSIGSYSMITQQPLSGRAQFGGQRLGEMEVWALEAFGAAHLVREMLTVKSDDVIGRILTYEAIVNGTKFPEPRIPEAFRVLVRELRGMALNVTLR
ncbi:MAG: DNA-directed RNA polymerase subunit beta, partial [Cytophagales bacterium]|nr:DNA-directed RNA polymerase subunit beta [Cytophagales bacterium]